METPGTTPLSVSKETANEDETSSTSTTEERLLGYKNGADSINTTYRFEEDMSCCPFKDKKCKRKHPRCTLFWGTALALLGITFSIWTPFQLSMLERLRMRPGLPPYIWWENPPDEVYLRVYVFNITNSEEFLNGTDARLRLQEVGPIVFKERLTQFNVTFNDNGTLTYVANRTAVYIPEENHIDLNQTIFVPNFAVLGIASFLWDASFFTKFAFNLLVRSLDSKSILQTSINDYLWNFTDPILDVAQNVVPSLVPTKNMGILSRIYSDFQDVVTVYTGTANGHERFFTIDKFDGSEYLPGHGGTCEDKVVNSTEGVTYPQFLKKNTTLWYWRKTLCQVMPLYFKEEVSKYGFKGYTFALPNTSYSRTQPAYADCYIGDPPLPSGLSDVSKCYYDFPMASSFPHFLHGDERLKSYVDGLEPAEEKHKSFVIVEPITGIPMESRARSQSNLVVKKLTGFNEVVEKFSDTVIPMFWAEYNQAGLPFYIRALMYFVAVLLPYTQVITNVLMIIVGLVLIIRSTCLVKKERALLVKNKTLQFAGMYCRKKKFNV